MLKRDIKYEDFNGNTVTEPFYFNLTKTEIIQMQVDYEGGLEAMIQRIVESKDEKALFTEFKKIILKAYGVKSEDGKRFIKNQQLRDEFEETAAFDALFIDLATNENAAVEFMSGVVPKDLSEQVATTVQLPPPPISIKE